MDRKDLKHRLGIFEEKRMEIGREASITQQDSITYSAQNGNEEYSF